MHEVVSLLGLALKAGLIGVAIVLGLRSRWPDVTYVFRHPQLLAKAILARNVIVPAAALLLVSVFTLHPPVGAVLLAASVTALPPFLPGVERRAGVRDVYSIGMLASQTILAIVLVPLTLAFFGFVLGAHAHFPAGQVAAVVGKMLVLPFSIGLVVNELWPRFAEATAPRIERLTNVLVVVGGVGILVVAAPQMFAQIGNGTVVAMALLAVAGLAAGHLIGGPSNEERSALALMAASSHPGLALAVVATNMPAQTKAALAAVMLNLIVGLVLKRVYAGRRHTAMDRMKRTRLDRRDVPRLRPDRRRASST